MRPESTGFPPPHRAGCEGVRAAPLHEIARALFGPENRALSSRSTLRWGRRGSLAVEIDRKVWRCHESGAGGGVLDLVVHAGAVATRRDAADWLRRQGWLALEPAPAAPALPDDADRARRQAAAAALWAAAEPLFGSPALTYLTRARAVPEPSLSHGGALRFLPAAPLRPYRPDGASAPALVALARAPGGDPIGVHLTFLCSDGSGKADVDTPRKMIGADFAGASVRLGEGAAVVVAEGIESALSAGAALDLTPVAALSAGGVRAWRAWRGVECVTFAPDRDVNGAGDCAARDAADRLHRAGVRVAGFAHPPAGFCDWNDAARSCAGPVTTGRKQASDALVRGREQHAIKCREAEQ
jgi:hypothetical protein